MGCCGSSPVFERRGRTEGLVIERKREGSYSSYEIGEYSSSKHHKKRKRVHTDEGKHLLSDDPLKPADKETSPKVFVQYTKQELSKPKKTVVKPKLSREAIRQEAKKKKRELLKQGKFIKVSRKKKIRRELIEDDCSTDSHQDQQSNFAGEGPNQEEQEKQSTVLNDEKQKNQTAKPSFSNHPVNVELTVMGNNNNHIEVKDQLAKVSPTVTTYVGNNGEIKDGMEQASKQPAKANETLGLCRGSEDQEVELILSKILSGEDATQPEPDHQKPKMSKLMFDKAKQAIESNAIGNFAPIIADVDVNFVEPSDGNTLLHWAVYYKRTEMVQMLLNAGAQHTVNNVGKTPLNIATEAAQQDSSYFDVKQLLLNSN